MTLITIYALLGDDIRLLFFSKEADDGFLALTITAMGMFFIELVLASIGKPEYFNSFFFWLDALSTVSIITDIKPAMDFITGQDGEADGADAASLARASRGARIGTRAGRMTRVIRLIRLIRIVKLYKSANQALVKDEDDKNKNIEKIEEEEDIDIDDIGNVE